MIAGGAFEPTLGLGPAFSLSGVFYRLDPLGGDIVLSILVETPPSSERVLGSPIEQTPIRPLGAEMSTCETLTINLRQSDFCRALRNLPLTDLEDGSIFSLYGWNFRLGRFLFHVVITNFPVLAGGYGSRDAAIGRIEKLLLAYCPEGFDPDAFNRWPLDRRFELAGVLYVATLSGVFRYPPEVEQAPPDGGAS